LFSTITFALDSPALIFSPPSPTSPQWHCARATQKPPFLPSPRTAPASRHVLQTGVPLLNLSAPSILNPPSRAYPARCFPILSLTYAEFFNRISRSPLHTGSSPPFAWPLLPDEHFHSGVPPCSPSIAVPLPDDVSFRPFSIARPLLPLMFPLYFTMRVVFFLPFPSFLVSSPICTPYVRFPYELTFCGPLGWRTASFFRTLPIPTYSSSTPQFFFPTLGADSLFPFF